MEQVTLALAILLSAGFAAAKLGQFLRLPSVTGYILAGLLLGPSGFALLTEEAITTHLGHFAHIALMLISFGIGEHLEIKKIRATAVNLPFIALGEITCSFLFVTAGTLVVFMLVDPAISGTLLTGKEKLVLAFLLGAVSIATAPAATLHVMQELRASGPLTTTLMQVVALDNGVAITFFGIAMTASRHFLGVADSNIIGTLSISIFESIASLLLGVITGMIIDKLLHRLKSKGEMLTAGLSLLLLCAELARAFHLSPLLAGIAAGFTIVNMDHRDVRLFRILNAFEPPIYVLFFTLAGAHLDLSALGLAGWVCAAYFLFRVAGKAVGAYSGALISGAVLRVRKYLGFTLLPQAGVAIGLIFLIQGDAELSKYSFLITPVVLGGIILSELFGPISTRFAVHRAGEADSCGPPGANYQLNRDEAIIHQTSEIELVDWSWEKLQPPAGQKGTVLFGASNEQTIAALSRLATLIAHYRKAKPLAVSVVTRPERKKDPQFQRQMKRLFGRGRKETAAMGYELEAAMVESDSVPNGIVAEAQRRNTLAIMLGHPLAGTAQEFQRVVEAVGQHAPCPVIVARFAGEVHTEHILVPVISIEELDIIRDVLGALSFVGSHSITLLLLLYPDVPEQEIEQARNSLLNWAARQKLKSLAHCQAVKTESRVETIVEKSEENDLVIMAAGQPQGLQRLFFGSLAESVAKRCRKSMLIVRNSRN